MQAAAGPTADNSSLLQGARARARVVPEWGS
eukprot:COSAG01_NODE_24695_length_770_cov_0.983607_3_plen_30_part_01